MFTVRIVNLPVVWSDVHEIVGMEFNRLRMKESGQWRITECNVDYQ